LTYAGKYLHNLVVTEETHEIDSVFKALADPTRRMLLDRLRDHNGQTLSELCDPLDMKRQSATQHLDVLVKANLVAVVRRGRERLHYLNPVPIHEVEERWISGFEKPRLQMLSDIRNRAEEYAMTETLTAVPSYVYVTYIRATAEQVWNALTDADLTAKYWGHANISDWQPGSPWEHRRTDGSERADLVRTVLQADARSIEVREDVLDEYMTRYRAEIDQLIWSHPTIEHTHYKNPDGRIFTLSPWPTRAVRRACRRCGPARVVPRRPSSRWRCWSASQCASAAAG